MNTSNNSFDVGKLYSIKNNFWFYKEDISPFNSSKRPTVIQISKTDTLLLLKKDVSDKFSTGLYTGIYHSFAGFTGHSSGGQITLVGGNGGATTGAGGPLSIVSSTLKPMSPNIKLTFLRGIKNIEFICWKEDELFNKYFEEL